MRHRPRRPIDEAERIASHRRRTIEHSSRDEASTAYLNQMDLSRGGRPARGSRGPRRRSSGSTRARACGARPPSSASCLPSTTTTTTTAPPRPHDDGSSSAHPHKNAPPTRSARQPKARARRPQAPPSNHHTRTASRSHRHVPRRDQVAERMMTRARERATTTRPVPLSLNLSQSLHRPHPPSPPIARTAACWPRCPLPRATQRVRSIVRSRRTVSLLSHLLDRGRGKRRRTDRRGCRRPSRPPRTAAPSICGGIARPAETPARCDRHGTGPHETTSRVGTRHTQREERNARPRAPRARGREVAICGGAKKAKEEHCAEPIEADGTCTGGRVWDASPPRRTGGL